MKPRLIHSAVFGVLLTCVAASTPALSDPLPAPSTPLRDYLGVGVLQVDVPSGSANGSEGLSLVMPMRQAYVAPDRILLEMVVLGQNQVALATRDSERTWNTLSNYIVVRSFRNLDSNAPSPIPTARMSMAAIGRAIRDSDAGKLLPEENLDELKKKLQARSDELTARRDKMKSEDTVEGIRKKNELAAEHSQVRDDLAQIEVRRKYPCLVVEFTNKEIAPVLLAKGLMRPGALPLIEKGKTTIWMTRAEGLPVKIVTTGNDGKNAIYGCFFDVQINGGLKAEQLNIRAPEGTRLLNVIVDLRNRNWEDQMERDTATVTSRLEKEQERAVRDRATQQLNNGKQKKR